MKYLIIGMMIALVDGSYLAQFIVIFAVFLIVFIYYLIFRPWKFLIFNIIEIVVQLLFVIVFSFFLVLVITEYNGDGDCCGRDDWMCWLILVPLVLALLLFPLFAILFGLLAGCGAAHFLGLGERGYKSQREMYAAASGSAMYLRNDQTDAYYTENFVNQANVQKG